MLMTSYGGFCRWAAASEPCEPPGCRRLGKSAEKRSQILGFYPLEVLKGSMRLLYPKRSVCTTIIFIVSWSLKGWVLWEVPATGGAVSQHQTPAAALKSCGHFLNQRSECQKKVRKSSVLRINKGSRMWIGELKPKFPFTMRLQHYDGPPAAEAQQKQPEFPSSLCLRNPRTPQTLCKPQEIFAANDLKTRGALPQPCTSEPQLRERSRGAFGLESLLFSGSGFRLCGLVLGLRLRCHGRGVGGLGA